MPKGAFVGTEVNYEAGQRIRLSRKALGWTQRKLVERMAAELGIRYDQSVISDWEKGIVESPYAIAVWLEAKVRSGNGHIKRYGTALMPLAA